MAKPQSDEAQEVNKDQRRASELVKEADKAGENQKPAEQEKVNATELSKKELVNEVVDQETGEVKQGQPGASAEGVTDRPPLSEQDARRINGYAGFENIAEQQAADPNRKSEDDYDTLVEKK